jgi:hypothetical protein
VLKIKTRNQHETDNIPLKQTEFNWATWRYIGDLFVILNVYNGGLVLPWEVSLNIVLYMDKLKCKVFSKNYSRRLCTVSL